MSTMSTNILRYGREAPLPKQIELRAGPLSLVYHDGDLRYVRLGDQEILRRIYVAVRDHNWDTIPAKLSDIQMDIRDDSFRISYTAEHVQGDVDFCWDGTIEGKADGTVHFGMEGRARSAFLRNRIGFCVLHPMTCAGVPCVVEKVDGTVEEGHFPQQISPHQPFMEMRAITHQVRPDVRAMVRFQGDTFEMEDQRNWTDASYKTYCTPLTLPFPVQVEEGTAVEQAITLSLVGALPSSTERPQAGPVTVSIGQTPVGPLPAIGLGISSQVDFLNERQRERLQALGLSHLRVDLFLAQSEAQARLRRATAEAAALGIPLEVALHLSDAADEELAVLTGWLETMQPAIRSWLVFHTGEKTIGEKWVRLARRFLEPVSAASIGAGTDAYFTELNRERPPIGVLDLVCYSLNPQVHAFDNLSLMETLPAQAVTVESARRFVGECPIAVTPITLRPRFNPNATGPVAAPPPDELPPQVDERQMSLFAAAWTVGSLRSMAESSAHSVTYYETVGWRGLMERESGSALPEKFPSLPDAVFPVYHVFADVGALAGGTVLPIATSNPLAVTGLALGKEGWVRVLLANLTADPQQVMVHNVGEQAQVRPLDERNGEEAMRAPEAFRAQPGRRQTSRDGTLGLHLLPYAVVRIDTEPTRA